MGASLVGTPLADPYYTKVTWYTAPAGTMWKEIYIMPEVETQPIEPIRLEGETTREFLAGELAALASTCVDDVTSLMQAGETWLSLTSTGRALMRQPPGPAGGRRSSTRGWSSQSGGEARGPENMEYGVCVCCWE